MSEEKIVSTRTVFSGRAVRLKVETVELPDGRETTREIVEHDDCVAMVPLDSADNVLLVQQFRTAPGKSLLEIPAGGIDRGEDPERAVRRELQEEIGYVPGKLEKLGGFYSTPGYCTEYLHLFLATDLTPGRLFAEDTAGITVVRVPVGRLRGLIDSGAICDAKSIAGLLIFLERRALLGRLP